MVCPSLHVRVMSPCCPRLFDVSKQVVGQMFVHGVNVLISDVGSARSSGNACVFYFLNILIDTTVGTLPCASPSSAFYVPSTTGVGAIYLTLHLLTWIFTTKLHFRGYQSGQYGSPPSLNYWARQATVYVVSLTSMKLLVILLLASWHKLLDIGVWLLSWLGNSDAAQVVLCVLPSIFACPGAGIGPSRLKPRFRHAVQWVSSLYS